MTGNTATNRVVRLRETREHLRHSDPVMRQLIGAHTDFDPRAWLTGLPKVLPVLPGRLRYAAPARAAAAADSC